jgi:hypothetical protein
MGWGWDESGGMDVCIIIIIIIIISGNKTRQDKDLMSERDEVKNERRMKEWKENGLMRVWCVCVWGGGFFLGFLRRATDSMIICGDEMGMGRVTAAAAAAAAAIADVGLRSTCRPLSGKKRELKVKKAKNVNVGLVAVFTGDFVWM